MSITTQEDRLEQLKADYSVQLRSVISAVKAGAAKNANDLCSRFHRAGVTFFNAFERTLDEYSLPEFQITQDVINRKGEDALNIAETIIGHWKTLRAFCSKFSLATPQPSPTAYSSLQRVIKRFYPESVSTVKGRFLEANLPVYGFECTAKHSGWKMKTKVAAQIVIGIVCLVVGIFLAFHYDHPNGTQYLFIRGLYALGMASIASSILVGSARLKWSVTKTFMITAAGSVAVMLILYYLNPPSPPNPDPVLPKEQSHQP